MDGSMSGSVNGMVINTDGSKFVTGGDDKVRLSFERKIVFISLNAGLSLRYKL